jgi:hypothetical protein
MASFQYPDPQLVMQNQYQQLQQMFPQPQGSVYSIKSPLELGNVPIGSTGLSVVLCLSEDIMYIKSFQNGAPVVMAYRVSPYQKEEAPSPPAEPQPSPLEARIGELEATVRALVQELTTTNNTANGGQN